LVVIAISPSKLGFLLKRPNLTQNNQNFANTLQKNKKNFPKKTKIQNNTKLKNFILFLTKFIHYYILYLPQKK